MRIKKKVFIVLIVLICFAIMQFLLEMVMSLMGYNFITVKTRETVGIPSYDGKYSLVRALDQTGRFNLFAVTTKGSQEPVFVTDDFWYRSRYISGYGWFDQSYDFYIKSSDSGIFIYHFENDTWIPETGTVRFQNKPGSWITD